MPIMGVRNFEEVPQKAVEIYRWSFCLSRVELCLIHDWYYDSSSTV